MIHKLADKFKRIQGRHTVTPTLESLDSLRRRRWNAEKGTGFHIGCGRDNYLIAFVICGFARDRRLSGIGY
jgi:hypothetical protein